MAQRVIASNKDIADQIKKRRNELNLTIEEAALRAGVGTKTWSRYEAGNPIRRDKCKGICKALNWRIFPNDQDKAGEEDITDYTKHMAWSKVLADHYGYMAAKSFSVGSDILLDNVNQDLQELARQPIHTHIGQLQHSFTLYDLPQQFLMQYDYDFMYRFQCGILWLRQRARQGFSMIAHTVLEEIIYYMCIQEAKAYMELEEIEEDMDEYWADWIFDMFDDCDVEMFLFSHEYITEDNIYHFSHWSEKQLFMD